MITLNIDHSRLLRLKHVLGDFQSNISIHLARDEISLCAFPISQELGHHIPVWLVDTLQAKEMQGLAILVDDGETFFVLEAEERR